MTQNKELGKGKVIQHKMKNKWKILQKVEKRIEDMLHKNGEQKEIERRYEEQGVFFLLFSKEIIRYVFERYCVDLMVFF